jgi:mannan endo-1,4-beta-mannosidase
MARTLKALLCGVVALAVGANAAPKCAAPTTTPTPGTARTFEAEDAILSGTTVDTAQTGFTGEQLHANS